VVAAPATRFDLRLRVFDVQKQGEPAFPFRSRPCPIVVYFTALRSARRPDPNSWPDPAHRADTEPGRQLAAATRFVIPCLADALTRTAPSTFGSDRSVFAVSDEAFYTHDQLLAGAMKDIGMLSVFLP